MFFFDKILRIIKGHDYDKKNRNIEFRILELKKGKKIADDELERLKKVKITIPNFDFNSFMIHVKVEIKPFEPPKTIKIRTMKDLMEKRKREEAERIRLLKQQVVKNFETISSFIHNEEPDAAEDLLFKASSALQEIKDENLNKLYNDLKEGIFVVRETLRQREIKRLEEEARLKAEEEARRIEQERIQKEQEKAERLERERKAKEYEEKLAREEVKRSQEIERLTAIVTKKKDNGEMYLEYLKNKGIRRFYHFTNRNNLNLIKRLGGLYSWCYCEKNDINIPNPGGGPDSRRFDQKHGLEDYVRLSFCNDHPMAWRKHKEGALLVLLYIDIEVASFKETLFSDRNAASSSFSCGGDFESLQKVNISATLRNYVSRGEGEVFYQHQAECMIKTFLPIKYITNINNPKIMIF